MKLVHLTTAPISLGFLRGQPAYIGDRGFEVLAISSPDALLTQFGDDEQVETHAIELPRRITPIHDLGAVRRLVTLLRSIRPLIVHAHTPKGGLLGMISSFIACTPVRIYHMRGLPYMTATGKRRLLLKTTERVSCRLAHRVFCVSHSLRDVAIRDGICPPSKIVVFAGGSGNGVDSTDRFNPRRFSPMYRQSAREHLGIAPSDLVIGFVGRVVRAKGIHELATAWAQLRDTYPTAHLIIAGPIEPQDPADPAILARFVADHRVHTMGMVDDPSAIYPLLDVVALPTYREGFPNVPLEAAAMELPVVATKIPGCIDAVQDGVTSTLVPPRNADALRIAIERYLDNPQLRARHGKAGRDRVLRDFRQEVIWEGIYQEYVRLLEERNIEVPSSINMRGTDNQDVEETSIER